LLGISTYRHLSIFAIVSAPMLAVGLRNFLCRGIKEPPPLPPLLQKICAFVLRIVNARSGVGAMLAITVSFALWMFTPEASRLYRTNSFKPPIDLAEEIAFLEAHYPHAHLINHYNFGGYLIFYGHGKIPLFVDGRGATAYPDQLMKDYVCFQDACDGWESILDRYQVDGIMIPSEKTFSFLQDRFDQRKGWKTVFKGPLATIYMRTSTKP